MWQAAITLVESCYLLTRKFPKDELFGLTLQIRRAATSVPANIAEGYGREHTKSFIQFLRISQGSLKELETHLYVAQRVGLVEQEHSQALLGRCEELGKMLRALIRTLQRKEAGA